MKKRGIGIALSYTNTFLNMITGLFLSSFLIAQLGDESYGVYQSVSSFVNYLVLLEFGTGTIMSRNLAACKARGDGQEEIEKNISTIWSITNILSVAILVVSVAFYFSLDFVYSKSMTIEQIADAKNMLIFLVVLLIATFYTQTLNGIMLGCEDYTYSSSTSIVKIILRTSLLVCLIIGIKQAIVIAIVDASLGVGLAIFGYFYARRKFKVKINTKNFDKLILKNALPMCLAIFLQAIVNQANNNVGKTAISIIISPEAVTLYSVGMYIFSIFSSLATIPVSLYVPQVTKDVIAGYEGKELTKRLVQPSRLIIIVGGAILFGFLAAGKQFIALVYGEEKMIAWYIALILMVPMFINMTFAMAVNVLDVKNKRLVRSFILLITTAINIGLTIILINAWGIIGAAISTGICTLIQVVLMNIYYSKKIGIKVLYLLFESYKGIVVYHIIGAILGYFVGILISNALLSFLAAGCTYVLVAFFGFVLFGKNEYEKQAIKNVISKIKGKVQK